MADAIAQWDVVMDGEATSFHVLKSSGRTDEQVLEEVGDARARWLLDLAR